MAGGHLGTLLGAPDLERNDRNATCLGLGKRRQKARRIAHGFEEQADHSRRRLLEREVEIIGDGAGDLLPRRYDEVVTQPSVVLGECAEYGPGMGDEGHVPAALDPIRRRPGGRVDLVPQIEVTHAIAATYRHVCLARERAQPVEQFRFCIVGQIATCENRRGADFVRDRLAEHRLEPRIGHAEDRMIDWLRQRRDRGKTGHALDFPIVRIDRVEPSLETASLHAADHAVTGAARFRRSADHSDTRGF
jgi:hypothetical protein